MTTLTRISFIALIFLCVSVAAQEESEAQVSSQGTDFKAVYVLNEIEKEANSYGIVIPEGFLDGPQETDIGYKALKYMLGTPVAASTKYLENNHSESGGPNDEYVTPLTTILGLMSGLALVLGAILTAYIMWAGLTKTSVDGEFLGKKWDSYWLPIRVTGSLGMLAPFPGFGGLSLIQVAVLVLVLISIGMGSALWRLYLSTVATVPITPVPSFASTQFVNKVLKANACAVWKHFYDPDKFDAVNLHSEIISTQNTLGISYTMSATSDPGSSVNSGGFAAPVLSDSYCGNFTLTYNTYHGNPEFTNETIDVSSDVLKQYIKAHFIKAFLFGSSGDSVNHSGGAASNVDYIWNKATEINERILYNSIVGENHADFDRQVPINLYYDLIDRQREIFWNEMNSDSFREKVKDINSGAIEMGKDGGFFLAGPFYTTISQIQRNFNQGLAATFTELNKVNVQSPERILASASYTGRSSYNEFAQEYNVTIIDNAIKNAQTFTNDLELTAEDIITAEGEPGAIATKIARGFIEFVRGDRLADTDGSVGTVMHDPLMEFQAIGEYLDKINHMVGASLFGAKIVADMGNAAGDSIWAQITTFGASSAITAALKSAVTMLWGTYTQLLSIFVGVVMIYTVIIPTMPMVMWIVGCVGYLIYVAEALVASPFWMVMHSHPDGDEVTGKGASGYPIILTLVLYPSLMVVGLAAGMQIVRVIGWLTFNIAMPSIVNTLGESTFGLTSFVGVLLVYGSLVTVLMYKSFSLVHELPNSILRWMGVGSHFADLGEKEAMHGVQALKGEALGAAASMAGAAMMTSSSPQPTSRLNKDGKEILPPSLDPDNVANQADQDTLAPFAPLASRPSSRSGRNVNSPSTNSADNANFDAGSNISSVNQASSPSAPIVSGSQQPSGFNDPTADYAQSSGYSAPQPTPSSGFDSHYGSTASQQSSPMGGGSANEGNDNGSSSQSTSSANSPLTPSTTRSASSGDNSADNDLKPPGSSLRNEDSSLKSNNNEQIGTQANEEQIDNSSDEADDDLFTSDDKRD